MILVRRRRSRTSLLLTEVASGRGRPGSRQAVATRPVRGSIPNHRRCIVGKGVRRHGSCRFARPATNVGRIRSLCSNKEIFVQDSHNSQLAPNCDTCALDWYQPRHDVIDSLLSKMDKARMMAKLLLQCLSNPKFADISTSRLPSVPPEPFRSGA
jgi:hypothetical protein